MQTITPNRIVRFTFRRDGKVMTRPAVVTDVYEADKDSNPDPARNPRGKRLEKATAVSLVVFDVGFNGGSLPVTQAFEDTLAPRPNDKGELETPTDPMLGCWAWPTATPLNALAASGIDVAAELAQLRAMVETLHTRLDARAAVKPAKPTRKRK